MAIPEAEARRLLGEELREQLDRDPSPNPIWLALHMGCAAAAFGVDGPIALPSITVSLPDAHPLRALPVALVSAPIADDIMASLPPVCPLHGLDARACAACANEIAERFG